MDKKGISELVTVVIIILLVLSAVVIVWRVVMPMIKEKSSQITTETLTINLKITKAEINGDDLEVTVNRKAGEGELNDIKFILKTDSGSYNIDKSTNLEELETEKFIISSTDCSALGILINDLKSVEIAPIISSGEKQIIGAIQSEEKVVSNLVAKYSFDSDASDSFGTNHGTLVGDAQIIDGRLVLDGDGDYVEIDYDSSLALNNYTVSTWIKLASEPGYNSMGVFGTRFGTGNTFDFKIEDNRVHGDIGSGIGWINIYADCIVTLSSNVPYHIVYVIHTGGYEIYIDGNLCNNGAFSGVPLLMRSNQKMRIGHTGYGSEWFNGEIKNVRIYKKALSSSEISNLYDLEKEEFN